MQDLLIYLLKVSVCYAAIYGFYMIFLRKVTLYRSMRIFLSGFSIGAFFIPLLHFDSFVAPKAIAPAPIIKYIPDLAVNVTQKLVVFNDRVENGMNLIIGLLILGAVVCCVHFCVQFFSLKKITAKAKWICNISGIHLYHLDGDLMPFSFGKRVYVNETKHTADELEKIIQHERIHVIQKHTLDVILMECMCVLNWYNPFVWMIKKAVKQNLEFLADDAVIRNGTDRKYYQYLLLKTTGYCRLSLANKLSFSSLKTRIYMMNKTRNSKKHLLKFLLVLPVLILILLAFRNGHDKSSYSLPPATGAETFQVSKVTYAVSDAMVKRLVEKTQHESGLQAGKPFTLTTMKNERDRLKNLLEKNGYGHFTSHTITFLVDSSLTNNSFTIQVNINLQGQFLKRVDQPMNKVSGDRTTGFKTFDENDRKRAASAAVSGNLLQAKT